MQDKGTAKGRTYEESVAEALHAIAAARGDDCDAVGDVRGEGGKKGDVVVAIDACAGPARGKIVFEAKNSKLSKNEALAELDGAMETRAADYAVLVVSSEDKLPARTHPLREFNGDKLFVDVRSRRGLDARARGRLRPRPRPRADGARRRRRDRHRALHAEVERAQGAMEDVRRIKSQLTNATTGIEEARRIVDAMAANVRGHLATIEGLLADAGPPRRLTGAAPAGRR